MIQASKPKRSSLRTLLKEGTLAYIYLAFRSLWIIPNEIPSVSSHIAKYPMPGIAILGLKTLPPSDEIFLEKSSIEDTSIVFVTLPPSSVYAWLAVFSCFY